MYILYEIKYRNVTILYLTHICQMRFIYIVHNAAYIGQTIYLVDQIKIKNDTSPSRNCHVYSQIIAKENYVSSFAPHYMIYIIII